MSKEEPGRAPVASREFMGNLGEIPLRAEASALKSTFGRLCLLFVGSGHPKPYKPFRAFRVNFGKKKGGLSRFRVAVRVEAWRFRALDPEAPVLGPLSSATGHVFEKAGTASGHS